MLKFNNQGISLIESVMAMTLLSVGVLSIAVIFPFVIKASQTSERETVAANLAQAKIEEIFYIGYDNLATGTFESKTKLSENPENPFYHYQRETQIINIDGDLNYSASETGMKKITVTVYYNTPHLNLERSIPVSVIIAQK
jgi:Tfp pilus assembly protein PilV